MKIKKFNNIWTMGLLLTGGVLILLYLIKLIFPEFVVGVAELPSIVAIGTFIDTHLWAYYLVNGLISYLIICIYTCACCRIKKLDYKEYLIFLGVTIVSYLIQTFVADFALSFNFMAYVFSPLIVFYKRKINNYNILYSTCICFLVTTMAQYLTLKIRDISTLISYPNTATFFILVIDGTIWTVLLYLFYNYKKGE